MKATDEPNEHILKFHEKLKENFTEIEISSFLMTLLGTSEQAHGFIWDRVKDFIDIPASVKYSMVQHANFFVMLHSMFHDKLDETHKIKYMPVDSSAVLRTEEDFEKRLICIMKMLYKQLKKDGKI